VLCRCALVLCGIEKYSTREAALLLGIDYTSVESAYCAALQFLDVIGCEQFRQENEFAAVCN
jgi:DNA-directed RNA polymerase specialized sigma24 family protein